MDIDGYTGRKRRCCHRLSNQSQVILMIWFRMGEYPKLLDADEISQRGGREPGKCFLLRKIIEKGGEGIRDAEASHPVQ